MQPNAPLQLPFRKSLLLVALLAASSQARAQTNYERLLSFALSEFSSGYPDSPLIEGSDGLLYGTSQAGGRGGGTGGTVFRLRKDGSEFVVVHSFSPSDGAGNRPRATVLEGTDGALYGTTQSGNDPSQGPVEPTLFKVSKDGSAFSVLHRFRASEWLSQAPLAEGRDGWLYGTTTYDINNSGTVFKVSKDGSGYSEIHIFQANGAAGGDPATGVLAGRDGGLYGTTVSGGTNKNGTVFKLNSDGSGYTVLHSFDLSIPGPLGPLVEGRDGTLYGTTPGVDGGTETTVFKLNEDGSGFAVLHRFAPSVAPQSLRPAFGPQMDLVSLILGRDGVLYGDIFKDYGGDGRTVFKLNTDGSGYSVLGFANGATGIQSWPGNLTEGSDGALYGVTLAGGKYASGTVFTLNKDGLGYGVVHDFRVDPGGYRSGPSILASRDGLLYGATFGGGTNSAGTVFKLQPDGSGYSILRHFGGRDEDGYYPGELMEGSDGALYGSTYQTGTNNTGTVFKLTRDGSVYTVLHRFTQPADGSFAVSRLMEGDDGALYGTTEGGGNYTTNSGSTVSFGTIFKLKRDGSGYSVMHRFEGKPDGTQPEAGLLKGSDGFLYGTTASGGASDRGTVFKLKQDGSGYLVLHSFSGPDGLEPFAAMIEGRDGMLYGVTISGGTNDWGTVFTLRKDGTAFSLLHSFPYIGGYPWGGVTEGRHGVLYGTTYNDGGHQFGTVFSLNEDGTGFTTLYRFTGQPGDNAGSSEDLIIGIDGTLYGTTAQGGDMGQGTVFKVSYSPPRVVITGLELGKTGARLSLSGGVTGQVYQIQAATTLRSDSWQVVGSQPGTASGPSQFVDSTATNYPARFYRILAP